MTARNGSRRLAAVAAVTSLLCGACEREERTFRVEPPAATSAQLTVMSDLRPGTVHPSSTQPFTVPSTMPIDAPGAEVTVPNEYEENAWALAEGKRLYTYFNCNGCHAHGGGDIGPPLMDSAWIYGHRPEQVFATIVEGRPNGMPAWQGRIPDHQVWQLAAYVRSLAGLVRKDAAPGRNDDMQTKPPENSMDRQPPVNSSVPPSAEMPR